LEQLVKCQLGGTFLLCLLHSPSLSLPCCVFFLTDLLSFFPSVLISLFFPFRWDR
jgi:hypothetical protein